MKETLLIPYVVEGPEYDLEIVVQVRDFTRPRVVSVRIVLPQGEDAPKSKTVGKRILGTVAEEIDDLMERAVGDFMERISLGTVKSDSMAEILKRHRKNLDVTPDFLREVARIYKKAQADGEPPRQAVAQFAQRTPDRASQLIRKARDAGYLDDTTPQDKKKGRKR